MAVRSCGQRWAVYSSYHIIYSWGFNAPFSNEQPANGLWSEAHLFIRRAALQAAKGWRIAPTPFTDGNKARSLCYFSLHSAALICDTSRVCTLMCLSVNLFVCMLRTGPSCVALHLKVSGGLVHSPGWGFSQCLNSALNSTVKLRVTDLMNGRCYFSSCP